MRSLDSIQYIQCYIETITRLVGSPQGYYQALYCYEKSNGNVRQRVQYESGVVQAVRIWCSPSKKGSSSSILAFGVAERTRVTFQHIISDGRKLRNFSKEFTATE